MIKIAQELSKMNQKQSKMFKIAQAMIKTIQKQSKLLKKDEELVKIFKGISSLPCPVLINRATFVVKNLLGPKACQ